MADIRISLRNTRGSLKKTLTVVFGLLFLAVGIVGICLGVIYWRKTKHEQLRGRFGIIIDAGGSGTRLVLYEYKNNNDFVQVSYIKCEEEGLAKYTSASDLNDLKVKLKQCLEKAEKDAPEERIWSIPLYMEATAGMRVLKLRNSSLYDRIWNITRQVLSKSHFSFRKADTVKGRDEGIYAWTAVNYLKGTLQKKEQDGSIEMGSTSLQIAFIPSSTHGGNQDSTDVIRIDNKKYTVYAHSYLCYGRNEFERRYRARLVVDSAYTDTIMDPCAHSGHEVNFTSSYLWASPCSSGPYASKTFGVELKGPISKSQYTFRGSSNGSACLEKVRRAFNFTMNCSYSSCSFNGVYHPQVEGDYVAISAFYYPMSFMNLSSNVDRGTFKSALLRLCNAPWSLVKTLPGAPMKYKPTYCLGGAYSLVFLSDGMKFNDSNWNITFTRKINGNSISWTLGSQILKKDSMSQPIVNVIRTLTKTAFGSILAVSIIFVAIGFICVIAVAIYCLRPRQVSESQPSKVRSFVNPSAIPLGGKV